MINYKTLYKISLILIVLLSGACSENPAIETRYKLEKAFYSAELLLKNAKAFQENLTPDQINDVLPEFKKLYQLAFNSLENIDKQKSPTEYNEVISLTYQSANRLAQLYFAQTKYDSCISIYKNVLDKLTLNIEYLSANYINLGQSYQSSGNWDSALSIYNQTLEKFYPPVTKSGDILINVFNLPTGIIRISSIMGDTASLRYELNRTENYYLNIINDFPEASLAIAARASLARVYDGAGMWHKELEQLLALQDSTKPSYYDIILKQSEIYFTRLKKYDTAYALLNNLLNKVGPSDTLKIPAISFKMSQIKIAQKNYVQARKSIMDIKKEYPYFFAVNPPIQYAYARTFELDNKWNRAESEYLLLIEKFSRSREAMSAYLHIYDYYIKNNRTSEASSWFEKADSHFDRILNKYEELELTALTFKAELYYRTKDWPKTTEILVSIYKNYPRNNFGRDALMKAVDIYRDKLNDPVRADSLLKELETSFSKINTVKE